MRFERSDPVIDAVSIMIIIGWAIFMGYHLIWGVLS